uniref:ATP synthase F0 subunit 8 n=1 Tax=Stephanometra indica TaxID=706660 RepID=A0A6C0FIA4_9ECHI|nr:ATP synthase F0 subunit 8 [Stephanometra indica]QHT54549.1 ATP synthase F0 subunit 8 [Stephanometra indica]
MPQLDIFWWGFSFFSCWFFFFFIYIYFLNYKVFLYNSNFFSTSSFCFIYSLLWLW